MTKRQSHLVIMSLYMSEEELKNLLKHIEDISTINMNFSNIDWDRLKEVTEVFDEIKKLNFTR